MDVGKSSEGLIVLHYTLTNKGNEMTNATDNRDLDLTLRIDLANAAIAYANRCVDYADAPDANTKEAMFDAEMLMMDLVMECRDVLDEIAVEVLREKVFG